MADPKWPYNHKSTVVATDIDWTRASPLAFGASHALWRRISQSDAKMLHTNERYKGVFMTLDPVVQVIVQDIAENGEKPEAKPRESKSDKAAEINDIITDLRRLARQAEGEDAGNAIRAIVEMAKIKGLYDVPEEDNAALAERLAAARRRINGI